MADHVGQQFGNYRLLRELGRGTFATVYLGEHLYLERPAAIKLLHVQMEPKTHEAFRREAHTIAHLDHPHIVRVLDFGIEDQTPYLVMEYTPNGTLRKRHPKGTCLSLEQIMSYVKQIASALDYAHEQHVIHRDVKPENLLLNAKGEIVLSDFGIAVVQRTLASFSEQNMAGTPLYMAPEQIQHQPCPASDQYALAVMVYEWLCGQAPFHGTFYEVLSHHLHQPPPSLCAKVPHLSPAIEDAVFGALAKEPAQRFPTMLDFATVLEEACFATQQLSVHTSIEIVSSELSITHPVPVVGEQSHAPPRQQPTPPPTLLNQIVSQRPSPISVVSISAPPDRSYLEQWEAHLRPLVQAGVLTVWSESHLLAGVVRQQQIEERLDQADLIVLLLSADFFSSDDCIALMNHALHRQQHERVYVIPLLLRPVEWHASRLASLSYIPSNGLPVTAWTNRDAAFGLCVRDLQRLLGYPAPLAQRPQQALVPLSVAHRNRQVLLRKVRSFWVEGVLQHSLYGTALITPGLKEHTDVVADPWRLALRHLDAMPHPLPAGTRITQVYDASNEELLILGTPGSGKTTLLLELARDLLQRAESDEQYPLPVVFNLSPWALKPLPLTDWFVEELTSKYQVPRKLGRVLVEAGQILPLLDGLDEVAPRERTACIEAINSYRQEHGLWPLVVCSRLADYLAQNSRVQLGSAVVVQPLTEQQIDSYLESGGAPLRALRVALQQDAGLRDLARTPLMLNILMLTYRGMSVEQLLRIPSQEARQRQVFDRYVGQALTSRGTETHYTFQQTTRWLSWLARQLAGHSQTVFHIERMQPDWLEDQRERQRYSRIVSGCVFGLIAALFLGPISAFFFTELGTGLFLGAIIASILMNGLLFGLLNGLIYDEQEEERGQHRRRWSWRRMWLCLLRGVLNGCLLGVLIGLSDGLTAWRGYGSDALISILATGAFIGFLGGLLFMLIDGLLDIRVTEIRPAESFVWSWMRMGRNLVKFLGLGLLSSLAMVLLFELIYRSYEYVIGGMKNVQHILQGALFEGMQAMPFLAPPIVLISGLLGALTGGMSSDILDARNLTLPNQGIRLSARHSILVGSTGVMVGGIVGGLLGELLGVYAGGPDLGQILRYGLIFGSLIGLTGGLRAGGSACIQHIILRWRLWKNRSLPWNYARFLDYAAERILLCKVGGGYIFVHRLLLEYFASLEKPLPD